MVAIPPTVLEWSKGLASLSPGVPPCRGLRPDEWAETHRRCQEFVERWGMQAHAAGWDTLRLFGVGPTTGTIRGDFCGILMPLSVDIHEVTAEWIKLGKWTAYRHEPAWICLYRAVGSAEPGQPCTYSVEGDARVRAIMNPIAEAAIAEVEECRRARAAGIPVHTVGGDDVG